MDKNLPEGPVNDRIWSRYPPPPGSFGPIAIKVIEKSLWARYSVAVFCGSVTVENAFWKRQADP